MSGADRARADALARLGVVGTPPGAGLDAIVELTRAICRVPIALVTLLGEERQHFKARAGTDLVDTPVDAAICKLTVLGRDILVIPDLAVDPRTSANPLVTDDPKLRFYAGTPLIDRDGIPLGSLCAIDLAPHPEGLTEQQQTALEALGREVMAHLELQAALDDRGRALEVERAARASLIESRERLQLANTAARLGSYEFYPAEQRFLADARCAHLFGLPDDAPLDDFAGFVALVHPEDRAMLRELAGASVGAGGDPFFEFEFRVPGSGARRNRTLVTRGLRLGGESAPTHLIGSVLDVTRERQAERRQRALIELADTFRNRLEPVEMAFAAAEILGRTLEVSRAGYGSVDPRSETIVIERDWNAPGIATLAGTLHFRDYGSYIDDLKAGRTAVVSDADHDPRTRASADALKAISAHAFVNMPVNEEAGLVALLYLNHESPRDWPEDELAFVREVAVRTRDAIERKRAEAELAALNASLESQVAERSRALIEAEEKLRQSQKMEAVGQLTGGLAHDFNNMLAGISGALEMMQVRMQQGRIADLDRYVTAAQGAARRAAALTHRLLAFSRRQALDPRPTDVNRLIDGLEELIRRTVGPSIEVEVVGAGGLWTALIDPNQLENALLNLCLNARDAMPDGGRITIETANRWLDPRMAGERDLPEGQYLSICVTDTGVGMSAEVQARAFDPFFTTKPLGEGTGLGLSMIYGFVRQSGGQVRIYSEIGDGTTMCLYLPRFYGHVSEDAEAPEPALFEGGDGDHVVLVVDDEPAVRMLVGEVLGERGYRVLEAADGASALKLLEGTARLDLLITDVGLPGGMNGRQVADAARVRRPDLKVLFVTGYAENAVFGNSQLERGMQLLTKPFAMDLLATRVRDLLAG